MNGLREKFRNKKGFTLIEMLIVVAIIAILVAVSIPLINSSLERAREATDAANERAAKAEAAIMLLTEKIDFGTDATKTLVYNAEDGSLGDTTPTGYGKCASHKGSYVVVRITKSSGKIEVAWATSGTFPTDPTQAANKPHNGVVSD